MVSGLVASGSGDTRMRKDARRNRSRLIVEARRLFGERGIDGSLEEVAARSEVGIGTLYRHFPSRDDLVRALYDEYVEHLGGLLAGAVAETSGWDGVARYVESLAEWMFADQAIGPIMRRMAAIDPAYRPADRFIAPVAALVQRARDEGTLRPDVDGVDLSVIATMLGSLGVYGPAYAAHWRRELRIVLDGLRASPGASSSLATEGQDVESFHRMVHGVG